jgi:hypothetical protein
MGAALLSAFAAVAAIPSRITWIRALVIGGAICLCCPAAHADGCTKDTDCKGERVCDVGLCVDPHTTEASKAPADHPVQDAIDLLRSLASRSGPPSASQNPAQGPAPRQAPSPAQYARPQPTPANVCATNVGACPMRQAVPQGSPCYCMTPRGSIAGIAR